MPSALTVIRSHRRRWRELHRLLDRLERLSTASASIDARRRTTHHRWLMIASFEERLGKLRARLDAEQTTLTCELLDIERAQMEKQ